MLKTELLEAILSTSGPTAKKCSNRSSWNPFCRFLGPMPENVQNGTPGAHFVDFRAQCQKMLKSELLELILPTSGPNARKCSNRKSWKVFCRLLGPTPENAQIGTPGPHFVDFWAQCQKMLKSVLLEPILSTSRANARNCSNRSSWNPFCRLLGPLQKMPTHLTSHLYYRPT